MRIWGLTGSIGMGKTTTARAFRRLGVPVFDADAAVHALQARGGAAVRPIAAAFPGTVANGAVVREALRAAVLADPSALKRLEAIVHPLVQAAEARFLTASRRRGEAVVVLDIPLLFETRDAGRRRVFDTILVVSAPASVQRGRVLRRPGMTPARFAAILARQMPDSQKRQLADQVILTGLSRHHTQAVIRRLLKTPPAPRRRR